MSDTRAGEPFRSPIHYRPAQGRLADTIPFYWQGAYHIFYLRALEKVPWEHLVSTDLIHWTELPAALVSDGPPDSADGLHMFTGSVIEKDGAFHIFYTGWNPANPAGREFILRADSPDLIHWTKRPEFVLAPDGVHYSAAKERDFRDPYVFWNEAEGGYWMLFCSGAHTGLATSPDLQQWTLQPPLISDYTGLGTPECPDYFQIGDTRYLIVSPTGTSSTIARYAADIHGPYRDPVSRAIDTPILYAAKRLFDGKRHILTGWLRDLEPERDDGSFQWGGTQSVPREAYPGPDGQLYFRPVPEAVAVFTQSALDLAEQPPLAANAGWRYGDSGLIAETPEGEASGAFAVPDHYFLEMEARLSPGAVFTLALREPEAGAGGYQFVVRPEAQEAEIGGLAFRYPRPVILEADHPLRIQAFIQGTLIECFLNDAFAFSCRAYDYPQGRLGLRVARGTAVVSRLRVSRTE